MHHGEKKPACDSGDCRLFRVPAAAAIAVALAISWGHPVPAAGGAFTASHHDARALAMGGATVALANGDAAVHWNPSRLPFAAGRSATVAYGSLIEGFSSGLTTISAAVPWGGEPADEYGVSRTPSWSAGIEITRLGFDEVAGGLDWSEIAAGAALARSLGDYASAGLRVRYLNVSSDVEAGGADGVALDLSATVQTTDRSRVAVVARNAASTLRWDTGHEESLQRSADLAVSYESSRYGAAEFLLTFTSDGTASAAAGFEFVLDEGGLALRAGIRRVNDEFPRYIPSMGVGVPVGAVEVGYAAAFDDDTAFGTVQRFSVTAVF